MWSSVADVYRPGDPGFITPGSDEHNRLITASKVAAICGVSRWNSPYSLWHQMRGNVDTEPPKDIYNVGHAFEYALAELWKLENPGWKLSRGEVQFVTDKFGFPAMATADRRALRGRRRKLLEFKIARDLSEWGDPDLSGDLPADYVTQVIFQMMVSGIHDTADVVLMTPWFKHVTYHVEYDQVIADWITRECQQFWDSILSGDEPDLDDTVATYTCVKDMHPDIDGTTIEAPADLITQIRDLKAEIGPLEDKQRGLKTQLLDLMGNARHAEVAGDKVARRQPGRGGSVTLVVR